MAGTPPNYDNVRMGGPDGLRIPQEAGVADFAVNKLVTIALGALSADNATTLTPDQCQASEIIVTASGAHNVVLSLPGAFPGHLYTVFASVATGQTVTLKVTGQTGVAVASAKRAILICESTDIARVTADT